MHYYNIYKYLIEYFKTVDIRKTINDKRKEYFG